MTKTDIIESIKALCALIGASPESIWVSAGSALCVLGLRTSTLDVDAGARSAEFYALAAATGVEPEPLTFPGLGTTLILRLPGEVDVHLEDETPLDAIHVVDGCGCYTAAALLVQKERLNRPKDQEDIRKLKELLAK